MHPLMLPAEPMHRWATDLFPIHRSLTGAGVRQTLAYLQDLLPGLRVESVASGTRAFDWTVPDEWTVRAASITHESGERVADIADHTLHLMGYSVPVDATLPLEALQEHLHSLPEQPDAIPYVTSYYERRWGFCMAHRKRAQLKPGLYRVRIDTDLSPGVMNYGEFILPGSDTSEIFLSTYVCHPSMANNELSGPVVTAALARWLARLPTRRYTYRIIFVPETIGSLVYLSRHLEAMRRNMIAGFVVTCAGDERAYSLMPSRRGDTLADRAARAALRGFAEPYTEYSFLERGSDERQYCSPSADLPVASIMRSKYGTFPEYHTSLDDLSFVTQQGLEGALRVYQRCLWTLEHNETYRATCVGEPQLVRHGFMPGASHKGTAIEPRRLLNILAYADGTRDLIAIAETTRIDVVECVNLAQLLLKRGLLEITWSGMKGGSGSATVPC
jgi:aminopeptidase-like protein